MLRQTVDTVSQTSPEQHTDSTVVILPFENLSGDTKWDHICEGLFLDLITDLSRFRSFNIISHHTSKLLKPNEDAGSEAVRQLGTQYLVSGTFRHFGGRIRINTQLVHTGSGALVWADSFDGNLEDIFNIQDSIVYQVSNSLQQQLDNALISAYKKRAHQNIDAYTYWVIGVSELRKGTLEADERAREYFKKALEIDPGYGRAYTGLSLSFFNEWSCQIWDRWEISGKGAYKYARKAFDLDENDYVSAMVLGRVHLYKGEYDTAEFYLRKSLQLNPNDTDNLIQVATCLTFLGYAEESLELFEKAGRLNPKNSDHYRQYGAFIHFELGEYTKCLSLVKISAEKPGWIDMPAYIAAAWYKLGNTNKMNHYWNLFMDGFISQINNGVPAASRDGIEWMKRINPFKKDAKISEFWDFMLNCDGASETLPDDRNRTAPGTQPNFFREEGAIWRIVYAGYQVLVPSTKGLHDISRLLKDPNKEIHCSELMGASLLEKGIEVIDQKAKKQYQERILELQEELALAEEAGNVSKATTLNNEYEKLMDHLANATGLGRKTRKTSGATDKIRSAVTWRIRHSINRLEKVHPVLARHLNLSIHTGIFCAYSPEKPVEWHL